MWGMHDNANVIRMLNKLTFKPKPKHKHVENRERKKLQPNLKVILINIYVCMCVNVRWWCRKISMSIISLTFAYRIQMKLFVCLRIRAQNEISYWDAIRLFFFLLHMRHLRVKQTIHITCSTFFYCLFFSWQFLAQVQNIPLAIPKKIVWNELNWREWHANEISCCGQFNIFINRETHFFSLYKNIAVYGCVRALWILY